ncbi:uncharacterized protein LOC134229370 [Saccostrea cucullata]|uniref:uncharacterized protein LOC134229370 n=1 Tax=Saccostrea cuccullata TaxID=36930 RepID=UPI002ED3EF6E
MASGFRKAQEFWDEQADFEALKNHEVRHQHGRGPCSIFILDTSSSLGEEGFQQMKETFSTIIDECANHPDIDENVAVILCGKQTRFHRYYSNQYMDIKHCLNDVEFGGPTPLTAAFILATACLSREVGHTKRIGDFHVHPRIILISDGRPTDLRATGEVQDSSAYETEEDKTKMLDYTRSIGSVHPIFCIPVGSNPDLVTLDFMSAQSRGGKIVYPEEARQFAKYSENMKTASMLSFTMKNDGFDREMILTLLACKFPERDFSELDQKDIVEICSKKSLYKSWDEIYTELDDEMNYIFQERDPGMLPLGSRVKRGRDWEWNNQDNNGPGTVIGHSEKIGLLYVEWDTGSRHPYRYGPIIDKYDVTVCNEPRILNKESIAVGSLVKKGSDWDWRDQEKSNGSIGTVYRRKHNGIVLVRWQNGQTTESRFGYHGKFDLRVCDPFSAESVEYLQEQIRKAELSESSVEQSESSPSNAACASGNITDIKSSKIYKNSNAGLSLLTMPKGKYFKNDKCEDKSTDVEANGMLNSLTFPASDQWLWKDKQGQWNPYPININDKINRCYVRNPNSTVIVTIEKNTYRVVMTKGIQINLTTREESEVKIVKN